MKSSRRDQLWSIGEVATRFELPTHVLRHWESEGLLHPERDSAGRRRYRPDVAYRVAAIVVNKAAGMSLEQIRTLLDADAVDRHAALHEHLAELERRAQEIERSRRMTQHALECEAHDITACPGFRAGVTDVVEGTRRGLNLGESAH